MPERPTLEHDGRRYQRQRGTWLDRGLTVPRTISQQLDAKAKEDPSLWDMCEAQDFEDDPRNRGRFRLDAELFPRPDEGDPPPRLRVAPQPVPGYQSSSPRRRKRDQDHLNWSFRKDGELALTCDINGGWRPTERAWYFHASAPVPLPGDHVLNCVVTIVAAARV